MGAMGGLLGLGGGAGGTDFVGPEVSPLMQGVNETQTNAANDATNAALLKQDELASALAGAGGIGKQQAGYGELGGALAQTQGLTNQYGDIAAGRGPNPAMAMLNQQTGQNISNQAALMAGQRGVGQNAGLLARQAAMQGGNLQQQAVGQGATMQANQSLNALNQMGSAINQQANIANARAGIGTQQVANQMAGTNAATQARQTQQANLLNAMGQYNTARSGSQSSVNAANASLAGTQMQGQQALIGGVMNSLGGMGGMFAQGGVVPGYADGGMTGPQSSFGQFLTQVNAPQAESQQLAPYPTSNPGAEALKEGMSKMMGGKGEKSSGGGGSGLGGTSMGMGEGGGGGMAGFGDFMGAGGGAGAAGGAEGGSLIGLAAMASDKRVKKDVKNAAPDVQKFLDALGQHSFKYKEGKGLDDKKHVGPMAQELEKSSTGRQLVSEPQGTKMVDYSQAGPAILASLAHLNEKVKSLEGPAQAKASGGMVDVVVSPGEKLVPPGKVAKAAGGDVDAKTVPGKAAVAGDSYKNDTVKLELPPGTIVIPRTEAKDERSAAEFVRKTLARRGKK